MLKEEENKKKSVVLHVNNINNKGKYVQCN